jgi:putative peptidoglycan binding protein
MRRDHGESRDLYGWNSGDDRADDWLAEQGELDWLTDPRRGESAESGKSSASQGSRSPRPARMRGGRAGGPSAGRAETIARRRIVAALAAGGVVVAVIVVVVATSGGGRSTSVPTGVTASGSRSTPQAATPTPQPTTRTNPDGTATTPTGTQPSSPPSKREVTLPSSGMLKLGDSGAAVVALQKALAALGFKVGPPDGSFGPATGAAAAAFQTAHGLTPDGIVGPATAKELNRALEGRG